MPGIVLRGSHIIYYSSPAGYLVKNIAVVDSMFRGDEMNAWLSRQNLQAEWRDGVYERLVDGGALDAFAHGDEPQAPKSCRVWRFRPDTDFGMRLKDWRTLCRQYGPPCREHYTAIYDGQVATSDLAALDDKFSNDPPRGFEYPLAMGDVLELYDENGSECYYADRNGFVKFDFAAHEPAPAVHEPEMQGL